MAEMMCEAKNKFECAVVPRPSHDVFGLTKTETDTDKTSNVGILPLPGESIYVIARLRLWTSANQRKRIIQRREAQTKAKKEGKRTQMSRVPLPHQRSIRSSARAPWFYYIFLIRLPLISSHSLFFPSPFFLRLHLLLVLLLILQRIE